MGRAKPNRPKDCKYVGKGGLKLEFALNHFSCNIEDKIVADLGSHQGGFVDCLLEHKVKKVYSVDTCYGLLDWKVRSDDRVVVLERKNALHWLAPEKLSFITIDVAWTKQHYILPSAIRNIAENGTILSLLKPQYEVNKTELEKGVLAEEKVQKVIERIQDESRKYFKEISYVYSPFKGSGGNTEAWLLLKR